MIISLHIIPKASKSELVGWIEAPDNKKALKVRIAALPEEGKANKALLKFLAKTWDIPVSDLELIGGEQSRHKRLKIHNSELASRLAVLLS